ncbi:MAG TPA: hypothetical protein VIU11_01755 [Nakamurella sp.]
MATIRLTVAQPVVHFLAQQYSERDGVEHSIVAGVGQALLQAAPPGRRCVEGKGATSP